MPRSFARSDIPISTDIRTFGALSVKAKGLDIYVVHECAFM